MIEDTSGRSLTIIRMTKHILHDKTARVLLDVHERINIKVLAMKHVYHTFLAVL